MGIIFHQILKLYILYIYAILYYLDYYYILVIINKLNK